MATIAIRNDLHRTTAYLRQTAEGTVSGAAMARAARKLCPFRSCACSGWDGIRGIQDQHLVSAGPLAWYGPIYRAKRYRVIHVYQWVRSEGVNS